MAVGRNKKCAKKGVNGAGSCASAATIAKAPKKVMPHNEFIDRIRKSLYFGADTLTDEMEVSRPFAEYASELFSEPHKGHTLNRLHYVAAGAVHASPCSLIMALIYLDRLNMLDPGYVRRITPQELFIVSMMISTKFYTGHDEEIYMSDWAEDGDITEDRLKQLELEFLCAIDWNIYISNEQFFDKLNHIEHTLARREGLRRGWLTYTELTQMLPSFALAKFLLNNIAVMAVSYAAGVMTIAGAFLLASQIPGTALYRKAAMPTAATVSQQTVAGGELAPPCKRTIDSTVVVMSHNDTCEALNVEAELLKLEQQYREESAREDMLRRNNEIDSVSRLTLPDAVHDLRPYGGDTEQITSCDMQQSNWLALQAEYRDALLQQQQQEKPHAQLTRFDNCTMSALLWSVLLDAAEQSAFMRFPLTWFKFI